MIARRILLSVALTALLLTPAAAQERKKSPPRDRTPANFTVQQDVEYGRAGERSLKLDVYLPKEQADTPRPAVVWIHGGGWRNGDKASGRGRLAPLIGRGDYVGFSVGYRLSGEATWPAQVHDCKAAIRWIRANAKEFNVDPERIGVWGSSAGGHLVALLGTSGDVEPLEGENGTAGVSSRVTCVVDFCGPADFPAFARQNPGLSKKGGPVWLLLGGAPEEKPDAAKAASPITWVSKDDPPILIVHGTADAVVPFPQAEAFHKALKDAGVDSVFVRIEEGGHGIGGREVNTRVVAFFDKHLHGKPVEVSSEPIPAARPAAKKRAKQRR